MSLQFDWNRYRFDQPWLAHRALPKPSVLSDDAQRHNGVLAGILCLSETRRRPYLKALAKHPEIVRDATGFVPGERAFINRAKLSLRWIDDHADAQDRLTVAEMLVPFRAKFVAPAVPKGCRVRPIPDLSNWYGAHAFLAGVKPVPGSECHEWSGATSVEGYGRVKIFGKLYSTHRVAYTLEHGPIPVGRGYHGNLVMHTCDNPRCCNPAHLKLGTARDNARDMARKGRGATQRRTAPPSNIGPRP